MSDAVDELADLLARNALNRADFVAQRIVDAGWRRVVVDDAMIERFLGWMREHSGFPGDVYEIAEVRAALTAALETDNQ